MRKYLHLITEHETDPDMVGQVEISEQRNAASKKNEETVHTHLDMEASERYDIHVVSLGYADFDSEEDYRERVSDVVIDKLTELDDAHLRKAGVLESVQSKGGVEA